MPDDEWRFLLAGPSGDIQIPTNPAKYISENAWPDLYRQLHGMENLSIFEGIRDHFMRKPDDFHKVFDSINAHEEPLPAPWNQKLDQFQKIIFLKALRPDKVIPAVQSWIVNKIGRDFIVPPTFDLSKCYRDSSIMTPLIFVLSTGSDPIADFQRFATEQEMSKRYESISLGQGQGPKAEKLIRESSQRGGWVLLQNVSS